jgi:hypothetical protein
MEHRSGRAVARGAPPVLRVATAVGANTRLYYGFGCGAAHQNCCIDSRGNVWACNFLPPGERIDRLEAASLCHPEKREAVLAFCGYLCPT